MVDSGEVKPPSPKPPQPEGATNFWDAEKEKDYLALPTTPPPDPPPFTPPVVGGSTPNMAPTPNIGSSVPDVKGKALPPIVKPGQKLCCVDSRSIVIMSNSILLVSFIVHLLWNLITKNYIASAFAGGTIMMSFVVIFNIFITKSAACYVISATSIAILLLANYAFMGYNYYNKYNADKWETLQLPPFEGFVIGFIVVIGLIQLYRLQVFTDALNFAERNSIHRLRNSIKAVGRSLRGSKPSPIEP